jgi:UDP-2,4-diacetamido-2,4,6-trideoxy-beta-L-altropyranose hydrolase
MYIVFRLDANHIIGTGHLSRCLNLAKYFDTRIKNSKIFFFSCQILDGLPDHFYNYILNYSSNNEIDPLDSNTWISDPLLDLKTSINYIKSLHQVDLLIIDHYAIDQRWEKPISEYVNKIMVIDDLANRVHYCDYLLDATPQFTPEFNQYLESKLIIKPTTKFLLGSRYALLHSQYAIEHNNLTKCNDLKKTLTISFGGSDLHNQTIRILNLILENNVLLGFTKINVICGALSKFSLNLLRKPLVTTSLGTCEIAIKSNLNPIEMIEIWKESYMCIGSSGVSSFERCCLGLPSIIITVAKNQEMIAKTLHHFGAVTYLGRHDEVEDTLIVEETQKIMDDRDLWMKRRKFGLNLVDGNALNRIFDII